MDGWECRVKTALYINWIRSEVSSAAGKSCWAGSDSKAYTGKPSRGRYSSVNNTVLAAGFNLTLTLSGLSFSLPFGYFAHCHIRCEICINIYHINHALSTPTQL